MIKKNDLLINTNGYVLSLLEKILDANVEILGVENIPKNNPKLFIANHFTRTEAMLIPYTLYNITNKKVGVIADDSLFKSFLGNFLENLGAIKKSSPNRNEHIIGDLITSCKDWMIFPEGMMVKAKDISKTDKNFCVKIDDVCQRVYTGSAVFALTSQYFRQKFLDEKLENQNEFTKKYFISDCKNINTDETMIVPINISYSNLRTGKNFFFYILSKLFEPMEKNFKEELEIESNIVLNSKITIRILEPISTKNLLENLYTKDLSEEEIINSLRHEVTHDFMNKIYESLTINFDHIFILILFLYPKEEIKSEHFKRLIYITFFKIKQLKLFYDKDIDEDLIYLISYEKFKAFNNILEVAVENKILEIDEVNCYKFLINKKNLLNNHTHDTIRLKNILRVILNEILIQKDVVDIVNNLISNDEEEINKQLLEILKFEENQEFENSHEKLKNHKNIKPIEIGKHKYFENTNSNSCVIAIHGFSSSPKEMEKLALFLNKNGLNVQTPRLAGHGTIPEDLKDRTWQDWYKSVSRSIVIGTLQYTKIYIIGFSTGGLLALLSTKKDYKEFVSLVCINAALHLNDLRIKTILPAISFWNDIVKAFDSEKYTKEYIENFPENIETNYNKHYITSIEQLNLLMQKIKKILPKIKKPILIIQGKDDPVVNSTSAHEIFQNIESRYKSLKIVEAKNHVIVNNENSEELFLTILDFIKQGKNNEI